MTNTETTAIAKKEVKPIDTVRAVFDKMKPQFAMVLPRHITPDRMVRVALTAIQNTPKLLDCDKTSLYSAVMRAAQLGLEPEQLTLVELPRQAVACRPLRPVRVLCHGDEATAARTVTPAGRPRPGFGRPGRPGTAGWSSRRRAAHGLQATLAQD